MSCLDEKDTTSLIAKRLPLIAQQAVEHLNKHPKVHHRVGW